MAMDEYALPVACSHSVSTAVLDDDGERGRCALRSVRGRNLSPDCSSCLAWIQMVTARVLQHTLPFLGVRRQRRRNLNALPRPHGWCIESHIYCFVLCRLYSTPAEGWEEEEEEEEEEKEEEEEEEGWGMKACRLAGQGILVRQARLARPEQLGKQSKASPSQESLVWQARGKWGMPGKPGMAGPGKPVLSSMYLASVCLARQGKARFVGHVGKARQGKPENQLVGVASPFKVPHLP
eukprot:gene25572-biopygen4506